MLLSIVPADIALDHLQPPGPVMRPAVPLAQGIANPPAPQCAREPAVVPDIWIVAAHCHDDIEVSQQAQAALVVFIREVEAGTIVIDILVAAVTNPALDVEQTAHGEDTVRDVRMA